MNIKENLALIKSLRELYASDKVSAKVLEWLSDKQRSSRETKVRVAGERTDSAYAEIVDVFKKFKAIGAGEFIVGRHGAETRIVWNHDPKSMGQVAIGALEEFESVDELDDEDLNETLSKHVFNLRPHLEVSIELPSDLTEAEARRLTGWITALPF